jgi:hypothetical protein
VKLTEEVMRVEISKALLDAQNEIWIPLTGNCMWPVVKDGDELKITKESCANLKFGDIAIFQTSAGTFHANILFRSLKKADNYIGKVTQIRRSEKILDLDARGLWERRLQASLAPANPYFLNLPKTLWRKCFKSTSL